MYLSLTHGKAKFEAWSLFLLILILCTCCNMYCTCLKSSLSAQWYAAPYFSIALWYQTLCRSFMIVGTKRWTTSLGHGKLVEKTGSVATSPSCGEWKDRRLTSSRGFSSCREIAHYSSWMQQSTPTGCTLKSLWLHPGGGELKWFAGLPVFPRRNPASCSDTFTIPSPSMDTRWMSGYMSVSPALILSGPIYMKMAWWGSPRSITAEAR